MSAKGIDPRPAGYDERGGKKDHLSRASAGITCLLDFG